MTLFVLFGGELFLAFAALRVAIWVLRGWRDFDAGSPPIPPGPQGGLPLGPPERRRWRGKCPRAAPLRRAGLRRQLPPCRKVVNLGA